jgi:hypothetical protein
VACALPEQVELIGQITHFLRLQYDSYKDFGENAVRSGCFSDEMSSIESSHDMVIVMLGRLDINFILTW